MAVGGTVTLDPGTLPCKVNIQTAAGLPVTVYNDSDLTSVCTVPVHLPVTTSKVFYFAANGTYTVTIWVADTQIYSVASSITGGANTGITLATYTADQ